ncbi:MAG: hypothetical protein M3317_08770 [Actinomycetota bacterium]|nr:hypothetical protein [Actinomycetota bacterium]
MQEALTTPATRTRCARTSTGSPTFPRRKGGTGGWSWGLVVWGAAKHLEDYPEIAQGVEVGDLDPAVLTAEHHAVLALRPRDGPVEVRGGDGDGFDTNDPPLGLGLRYMRRRSREVGADLDVISTPGRGTTVQVRFRKRESTSDPQQDDRA